ncbi:MAG TPA: hypothetical protein G4O11_13915 [Anaerolineae bacterium]|nr:hypothetical protein [Anaerolineae bacterium]
MSKEHLDIGDLVRITTGKWEGFTGIVSQPITEETAGHVLIHSGGILGIEVTLDDVDLANETGAGFAQLAYNLIKLGSHVIEKKLIGNS